MKKRIMAVLITLVAVVGIGAYKLAHATTNTTNLSLPSLQTCFSGSNFTEDIALTASSMTNVNALQVNVTFTGSGANLTSVTLGSAFTGTFFTASRNITGSYLYGLAYEHTGTLSRFTPFTVLTFRFHAYQHTVAIDLHVTVKGESDFYTTLLNTDQSEQPFTTTDGYFNNCVPSSPTVDCKIDISDLSTVAAAFGTTSSSQGWNPRADINNDGKVSIQDLAWIGLHFGETHSCPYPAVIPQTLYS